MTPAHKVGNCTPHRSLIIIGPQKGIKRQPTWATPTRNSVFMDPRGPSIKYVTLFLANFYPLLPSHLVTHPGPPRKYVTLEPCAGRAAAADNLWAPPPTFVDRRAAADNLSARRRYHFCCVVIFLNFRLLLL